MTEKLRARIQDSMWHMIRRRVFPKREHGYDARMRRKNRIANEIYAQLLRWEFHDHYRALDRKRNALDYPKRHLRAALRAKRRALKQKATCGDTKKIAKIYARAATLRRWFDVVVDHIRPLCKGGKHTPKNLQIIYSFENAAKGTRLDYKPTVVFS